MKKNRVVLIVMIVLIAVALSFVYTEKNSTIFGDDSNFAVKDTANITKIYIADKNNRSVLFERMDNGWILNKNAKAHEDNMEMLLTTIKRLEVKYPVPQKAYDNIVKAMASNSKKVEVYKNDYRIKIGQLKLFPFENKVRTFYVGNATQDNQGTYMLMEDSDRPFVVTMPGFRGFVAARFTTDPKDWMSHEIFRIPYQKIADIKLESKEFPKKNYEIRKLEEGYEIMSLHDRQILAAYDTVALFTFLDAFKNINYESIIDNMPDKKVDSLLNAEPVFIITVKETNGKEHQIRTYKMLSRYDQEEIYGFKPEYDLDRMYAWKDDKMMLIQYFVFDKITRPIDFFYPPQQ